MKVKGLEEVTPNLPQYKLELSECWILNKCPQILLEKILKTP